MKHTKTYAALLAVALAGFGAVAAISSAQDQSRQTYRIVREIKPETSEEIALDGIDREGARLQAELAKLHNDVERIRLGAQNRAKLDKLEQVVWSAEKRVFLVVVPDVPAPAPVATAAPVQTDSKP